MPTPTLDTVSAADVEWIDRYGTAQVHGYHFSRTDIRGVETHGDRREDRRLTVAAKERIAVLLSGELRSRIAEAGNRAHEAPLLPPRAAPQTVHTAQIAA